ncbi:hypothetical protein GCM10027085_36070 [Spirosoma aerophilum]
MAVLGHSGSQAPQLMHSSVIMIAMSSIDLYTVKLYLAELNNKYNYLKVGDKLIFHYIS